MYGSGVVSRIATCHYYADKQRCSGLVDPDRGRAEFSSQPKLVGSKPSRLRALDRYESALSARIATTESDISPLTDSSQNPTTRHQTLAAAMRVGSNFSNTRSAHERRGVLDEGRPQTVALLVSPLTRRRHPHLRLPQNGVADTLRFVVTTYGCSPRTRDASRPTPPSARRHPQVVADASTDVPARDCDADTHCGGAAQ